MGNKLTNQKAITLIALVITIIILLILASISIAMLTGDNGIIEKARLAKIYSRKAEAQEYLELEIKRIRIEKQGNITLLDILKDFRKEGRTDIKEIKDIKPTEENPTEITVILTDYKEFSFTIGEQCTITYICGIEVDKWAGETLDDINQSKKITITAKPESQIENNVSKQEVEIKVTSEEWTNVEGKYAWNASKTEAPTEEEWRTLTLDDEEKNGKAENTESEDGEYYLWVKVTINGKTEVASFGPYLLAARPTMNNLVCVVTVGEDPTKGEVEVGSNKVFEGWKLTYKINNGEEVEIPNGTTIKVHVVKDDYIEVKYSKEGETEGIVRSTTATELKKGYMLKYNAVEGIGAPNNEIQYDNPLFTISSTKPTRGNYIFIGWEDSTGTGYKEGDTITVESTTTLYAIWKEEIIANLIVTENKFTEGTKITLGGQAKAKGIQQIELKVGDNVLYEERINNNETTYNKTNLGLDGLKQDILSKLDFYEMLRLQLVITSTTGEKGIQNVSIRNYTIGNVNNLNKLAEVVNNGNSLSGETVKIISDIDLTNQTFISIGKSDNTRFAGTMDGGFHTIKGLMLGDSLGLFTILDETAIVRSLVFEEVKTKEGSSSNAMGTVAARNYGTIQEIGVLSGELKSTGGDRVAIGGIAAVNYGLIRGCYSKANISGYATTRLLMGGICGRMDTTSSNPSINECYYTGKISETGSTKNLRMGGIVALCDSGSYTSKIGSCYSIGSFSRKTTSSDRLGGAIAGLWHANGADAKTSITQVFGINATYTYNSTTGSTTNGSTNGLLSSSSNLIGMSKTIGSNFVEDSTSLNQGLPVLSWEQNKQKIY